MRSSNPLITILPAMPPGLGEIERRPGKSRLARRVFVAVLVVIALGAALVLNLPASSP